MAGFFQQFLKGVEKGFLDTAYVRDFRHASKTFVSNGFGNAPKFKWLFHVYFDINKYWITNNPGVFPDTTNYGLLVKSVELPGFRLDVSEMNQYNRKRFIQSKINYDPVRITFHDDNDGQITHLWHTYYSYYYGDPSQPSGNASASSRNSPGVAASTLNRRKTYSVDDNLNEITNQLGWGYNGEISSSVTANEPIQVLQEKVAFFRSIRVYGFNQHNFVVYELINPIIESFKHDSYDYSSTNQTMEHTMSVRYESVKYFTGALNGQNPSSIVDGFGTPDYYDTTLSPISRPGSNKSILGQGGLLDAGQGILEDLSSGNILGALQKGGRALRTFKNPQEILRTAKAELLKEIPAAIQNNRTPFNIPLPGGGTGKRPDNTTQPTQAPPVPTATNNPIGP